VHGSETVAVLWSMLGEWHDWGTGVSKDVQHVLCRLPLAAAEAHAAKARKKKAGARGGQRGGSKGKARGKKGKKGKLTKAAAAKKAAAEAEAVAAATAGN
jgi:hypothetical protein